MKRNSTAFENLSGDWLAFREFWSAENVAALGQLLSALFIGIGVWIAFRQLNSWKGESIIKKRAEVAEAVLASALEASDVLKSIRSPFDNIPQEEVGNKRYPYIKRYERLQKTDEIFKQLRALQVRADAVLGEPRVHKAIETIFDVRQTTAVAIQMLADRTEVSDEDAETRKMYQRMRMEMWGTYSEKHDPLGMSQIAAIKELEVVLQPIVRLEYGKIKQ